MTDLQSIAYLRVIPKPLPTHDSLRLRFRLYLKLWQLQHDMLFC